MDQTRFDRIAAALGGAATRREGLRAALALLAGGAAASAGRGETEARPRRRAAGAVESAGAIDEKRPCGPKAKDNRCRKHKDCCTRYCKPPKGKRKIGRCRCVKPGRKCRNGQKCCGGALCQNRKCTAQPTCGAEGGPCASDATCCSGLLCQGGACAAEPPCVPIVCSGCAYATIQAAVDDREGQAEHRIDIAAGTYTEDLSISGDVTLRGCGAVTIKNATAGRRTIELPSTQPGTYPTVELRNVTVTTDTVAPNYGGGVGGPMDGNGDDPGGYGYLILSGTTRVAGNRVHNKGGGIHLDTYSSLTMLDDAEVSGNFSDTYGGGGVAMDSYGKVFMSGRSVVKNNATNGSGGGVYIYYGAAELAGSASVTGNTAGDDGGGMSIYADDFNVETVVGMPLLTMKDQSSVTNNTSSLLQATSTDETYRGGGGVDVTGACDDTFTSPFTNQPCERLVMSGSATISGNTAGKSGTGTYGGGVNGSVDIIMSDSASITGNVAYGSKNGATGSQVMLTYIPDDQRIFTVTETGSAAIGDQCRIEQYGGSNLILPCSA